MKITTSQLKQLIKEAVEEQLEEQEERPGKVGSSYSAETAYLRTKYEQIKNINYFEKIQYLFADIINAANQMKYDVENQTWVDPRDVELYKAQFDKIKKDAEREAANFYKRRPRELNWVESDLMPKLYNLISALEEEDSAKNYNHSEELRKVNKKD